MLRERNRWHVACETPSDMTDLARKSETQLYERVVAILEDSRTHIRRTVNSAMLHAYWFIGREIFEVEQRGKGRAGYGERLIARLAPRLTRKFGRGFSAPNLNKMRQFFCMFPNGSTLSEEHGGPKRSRVKGEPAASTILSAVPIKFPGQVTGLFPASLGWTHYVQLIYVRDPIARHFYELEAVREGWSTRALERQVGSFLFERLAKSRDKERVLELARKGHQAERPADILKDPYVLEFIELAEQASWQERDLEQAIIDRLQHFLMELGRGFCFVARQKRITVDGDHFYVDLVFYNRLLRCFVLVDLKLGRLTHQDLGQMQMYVHHFDRSQREEHEAKTIGIVLCSEKNDAMVKITLPEDDAQIHAASYRLCLPSEAELRAELTKQRESVEERLRQSGGSRP